MNVFPPTSPSKWATSATFARRRLGTLVSWAALLVVAVGCQGGDSTAERPPADAGAKADRPPAETDSVQDRQAPTSSPTPPPPRNRPPGADSEPASHETVAALKPEPPSPEDRPPTPDQPPRPADPHQHPDSQVRILAVTTRGPVLLELSITIDGRPFRHPLNALVDQAFELADANNDGVRTWDEFLDQPFVRYGGFGNLPANTADERRRLIQQYDDDTDGRVDFRELPRFLTRNAAQSQAFRFVSSNRDRYRNRSDSPLRLLLDEDLNGRLSLAEVQSAADKLRALDSDGDDILRHAEASSPSYDNMMNEAAGPLTQNVISQPESAMSLDENEQWDMVSYTLSQMYALGGEVMPDDFRTDPRMFAALDGDADGHLEAKELKGLLQVRPHVQLALDFAANASQSKLRVLEVAPGLPELQLFTYSDTRAVVELDGLSITFFMNDMAVSTGQQAAQTLAQLDLNRDGYLEREELPEEGLRAVFDDIDANGDEKLYAAELQMFLGQQQQAYNSQVQARAGESEDAVFTWLDADHDGRLGAGIGEQRNAHHGVGQRWRRRGGRR